MIRYLAAACFLFLYTQIYSQERPIELQIINPVNQLAPDLTQERSMVLISTADKGPEWKEQAEYLHKSFRLMGIDAVSYTHYLDYTASPTVQKEFRQYANGRKITFLILLHQSKEGFELAIFDRRKRAIGQECWYAKGTQLSEVVVALAIILKRTEHVNQNFLISQSPEYISILPVYTGNQQLNYPDRIKRLKLALMEIPEITPPDTLKDEKLLQRLESYNQEVRKKNEQVRNAFAEYPYKIEFVPVQDESALQRQGFQYIMYSMHSSVETLRQTLGFEKENKKEYVSQVMLPGGQKTLKTYQSGQPVYKWYIKQIVVSDVHVGRYWDADEDFISALNSFKTYLLQTLEN